MSNAVENLIIEIRDHYVAEFRSFILKQRATCIIGGPEVKFQLSTDTTAYRRLAVVDFVRNDGAPESVLFEPETVLTFDRLDGQISETKLIIDALRWDAAVIQHDAPSAGKAIAGWFEKWFDPDEINFDPDAEISACVHAVYIAPHELEVDFGTASAEAFWELLECLTVGGARNIHIGEAVG